MRDETKTPDAATEQPPPKLRGASLAPKHAFELRLTIGAHAWPDVLVELERLAAHIAEHGPVCNSAGGGWSGNSSVDIEQRPEQTAEKYRAELAAWSEARHG